MSRSPWADEEAGRSTLADPNDPSLLATVSMQGEGWSAWLDQATPSGARFPVWTGRTYADAWRAKLACRCALGWVLRRARSGVGQPLGLFRLTTRQE